MIIFPNGTTLKQQRGPLGVGGEGKVFRVMNPEYPGLVAKVYKQLPDIDKQAKIILMTQMNIPGVREVCAWPTDALVDSNTGQICGFTMRDISGFEPLHHYYSPAWQKKNLPFLTWDKLVAIGSNIAAAFSLLHRNGIVVGDVNPNSLRVSSSGRVAFIDTDSFQIINNDTIYRCHVGVPAYTAPELLLLNKSFSDIDRKLSHDCFGLAILIFHLLLFHYHYHFQF
jgi:DNA-binding helix-hairpin-helix protein with protein kinase domain